jgi:hypothetical protein
MKTSSTIELAEHLRAFHSLCGECFALAVRENRALSNPADYPSFEFCERRKSLLPRLEAVLTKLRGGRTGWQRVSRSERERCEEIKPLFQSIQGLLMKVLLLDRENQQAMLRRGLVPAKHLSVVASRQPHYIAGLYQRNATVQNRSVSQGYDESVGQTPDSQNDFRPVY